MIRDPFVLAKFRMYFIFQHRSAAILTSTKAQQMAPICPKEKHPVVLLNYFGLSVDSLESVISGYIQHRTCRFIKFGSDFYNK
jgi:hypothetical protein